MKKINTYIGILSALAFSMAFSSCKNEEKAEEPQLVYDAEFLECVNAEYYTRADGDATDDPERDLHDDNFEATALLNDAIGEGSVLYFTQLSNTLVPFTPEEWPDGTPDEMKEKFGDNYPNLYSYIYEKKEYESEWDEPPAGLGGYNFFPPTVPQKMNWDDIKFWGLNNNGFALFALFFPFDNKLNLDFKISDDQSNLDNLRKSNFIGAYHATAGGSAYSRLRFKLYHLMAYLKVTLYVPVYKEDDVDENGKTIRTGFPADALLSAEARDVFTGFSINWYANRSSDTSPACSAVTTGERTDVKMYIPPMESYEGGLPPQVTIKTGQFYASDDPLHDEDETDVCWEINISVLIPAGQDYTETKTDWTSTNFLRFNMRQNIGTVPKRYIFNGSSALNLIGGGDPLTISQGNIQHLNLYLPRKGAAAILLGATVEDWKQASNNNMGLQKDPPLSSGEEGGGDEPDPNPDPDAGNGPTD